jgi:hypothetical protein
MSPARFVQDLPHDLPEVLTQAPVKVQHPADVVDAAVAKVVHEAALATRRIALQCALEPPLDLVIGELDLRLSEERHVPPPS